MGKKYNTIIIFLLMLLLSNCNLPKVVNTKVSSSIQTTPIPSQIDESASQFANSTSHIPISIKESPDKYTVYVKDYVGKNCATLGYESLGGDRIDRYSHASIYLVMFTEEGKYTGISDDELKNYVVVAQNIEPNTEIKLSYEKDSDGNEYDSLIEWQSINEIALKIAKIGSSDPISEKGLTAIKGSPDKYTAYAKNYVGKNCATIGYESMGGDRMDRYLHAVVELKMVTESGNFVGVSNDELKDYVVVAQNIEPNTEIKFSYEKDSDGNEYDSLIEWQSLKEIVLKIAKVGSAEAVSEKGLTAIKTNPDKYTSYVKDYENRNLRNCGYLSLGGSLRDYYNAESIELKIYGEGGVYVEMEDESLKQYYVIRQNPSPNTEIKMKYLTNSEGVEYSNLIDWCSISEIELYVKKIE